MEFRLEYIAAAPYRRSRNPSPDEIRLLSDWMQDDILSSAGPNMEDSFELFDLVAQEVEKREQLCPHRIRPVRSLRT